MRLAGGDAGDLPAQSRYSAGERPAHWRKARAKLFSLAKPAAPAICFTGRWLRQTRL